MTLKCQGILTWELGVFDVQFGFCALDDAADLAIEYPLDSRPETYIHLGKRLILLGDRAFLGKK